LIDSRNLSCLRVFRVLLFYSVVIFPIPCLAWNAAGHRLAALIAWEHLDARTISETSRLLRAHPDFERWIKRAGDNNHDRGAFIEASTWPDDIRNDKRFYNTGSDEPTPTLAGFPDMERHRNWHFVNLRLDGAPSDPPISGLLDKQLVALVRTLASRNTSANERSYALPWLIHLVGDAHQPLHTSIRTDANGKWDKLGQGLTVSNPYNPRKSISTLHAFWDDLPGPPWLRGDRLEAAARSLIAAYPPPARSTPSNAWIEESWRIARDSGYPPGQDDLPGITAEFFENSREIAQRRVTQAGYRLAAVLNALFAR